MRTKVILHCSDSEFGNAALLSKWHVQGRGWSNIGYHYIILNGQLSKEKFHIDYDGHVETGRAMDDNGIVEWDERGAHTKGWNKGTVSVCLIGVSGKFTVSQFKSLAGLLRDLKEQYKDIEICQHSDFDKNKFFCAGFNKDEVDYFKGLI